MIIGIPTEIKKLEGRVSMTPSAVDAVIRKGHKVLVQRGAGIQSSFPDEMYQKVGAELRNTAQQVFEEAELIVKVKEPQPEECALLRRGQILFTYLHLAPDAIQAKGLINSGCTAIAYETITDDHGRLPLLAPMSEVAGRLSIQVGARFLKRHNGGRGILLGGVPGVEAGHVMILGGGVSGTEAARRAMGLGAVRVTLLDISVKRLRELDMLFGNSLNTLFCTPAAIEECLSTADLVIGAALIPGAAAPKLVTRSMLRHMRPGSVIVDISIDQGGCFETSRPTTHDDSSYIVDGIIHYCVANMPGAVPNTSSAALSMCTLPYIMQLAEEGYQQALLNSPYFLAGLNVHQGKITHPAVAQALGYQYYSPEEALRS